MACSTNKANHGMMVVTLNVSVKMPCLTSTDVQIGKTITPYTVDKVLVSGVKGGGAFVAQ